MNQSILHRILFVAALAAALLLTGCTVSLASDVTPPPDYHPTEVVATAPAEAVLPLVPPDPAAGAPIYTEKCLPCHGETGLGNGPQASKLPAPPPSIGTFDLASTKKPVDWFNLVTNGNFEKMMPGFSGSLNDRQRWDVVAYVYSMSMPADQLAQGQAVYTRLCADCHGESGKGNGPKASGQVHDWTQPPSLAQLSALEMLDLTMKGTGNMPGFNGQINAAESWAVVQYARSLTFSTAASLAGAAPAPSAAAGTPAAPAGTPDGGTPAANAVIGPVIITGSVINASGGTVPAGLKVELRAFDQMQSAFTLTSDVQADGTFAFADVETNKDRVFMATVNYNDNTFNSDVLHASDITTGGAQITLHIFDTSTDASAITADRMHVFFDFSKPDIVQVGELFIISNPTNKMVVAAKTGDPVLTFQIPAGATNLTFQDGELGGRFTQTENGFGDTQPIQPGAGGHQVLFAYDLPYTRKLDLSLVPPIPVGAVVVIAPGSGVKLTSPQLQDMGTRDMQNVQVHLYSAENLAANTKLNISVNGSAADSTFSQSSLPGILAGAGVLLLAVAVAAIWYFRRRQALADLPVENEAPGDAPDTVDNLLDAIVALDDLYQSGELPREAYDQRRAELKERLRLAHENDSPESGAQ